MKNKQNVVSVLRKLLLGAGVALMALAAPAQAAGLIILEGSDAQTYHKLDPYSTNFQAGLQKFSSSNLLPVLAVGDAGGPVGSAPAGTIYSTSIPSLADLLSKYSGLYIMSPGTCCSENDAIIVGHQADILAFSAAGRSIGVENFSGGTAFNFLLGLADSVDVNAHVAGFDGAVGGLGTCFDGNFLTPAGAAFGLGAVAGPLPDIGCFGHQAYEASFFDALGFTDHLADNPGLRGYNVVISNGGGGLHEAVPEPATLALFSVALLGLRMGRRKNVK